MDMTFDEYIQNPMGKENAVISNRIMYRNLYQSKLDKILVREAGKIDIKAYHVGRRYICYLKIPSEVIDKFYYDVLIEFRPPGKITGNSLKDYHVKFFSNDPSFVFTFTHAFVKNNLFIKDFANKMSKKAIRERGKEKNPADQVGYVKSIYFAYLIMNKRGYFSKTKYVDIYSKAALDREIEHADKKIKARQEAAQEKSKSNRKEREAIKKVSSTSNMPKPGPVMAKRNNIGTVAKVGTINKTNTIKKTKKK